MRVLHLVGYDAPYAGSFIPLLTAGARASRARGWDTELVFPNRAAGRPWLAELEEAGFPSRVLPPLSGRALSRKVKELADESTAPTVLHSHWTDFDVAAASAGRHRDGTAVFWHLQSRAEPSPASWLRNQLKWRLARKDLAGVLCVAPNIAESAIARGAPRERVQVWPNAIDVERFNPASPEQRNEAREQLGLPAAAKVVVHFGWDWHRKGGDVFLEAVRILLGERPEGLLAATVGGGDPARELSEELGIADSVRVLEPVEDVRVMYAAADLFATTSRAEGMPFAMGEALASGVPVAATDIPGQRMIGEGLAACRLTPLEPGAVAAAIGSLLDRPPDQAALDADAGRAAVTEQMGVQAWAERLADLYERTLPDGNPARR